MLTSKYCFITETRGFRTEETKMLQDLLVVPLTKEICVCNLKKENRWDMEKRQRCHSEGFPTKY